jgi:proteasome lid subunit RPN8/RPN11
MKRYSSACVSARRDFDIAGELSMPAAVFLRFLQQAQRFQNWGVKSYGLFTAEPATPATPFRATDVVFLDGRRNRRNDPANRAEFEAQGTYFRRHHDAGFVADSTDLLTAYRQIEAAGREIVGIFHSHRRQSANFSWIDFRLHNPAFAWHLILSYGDSPAPRVQPFRVDKNGTETGISRDDDREGSELAYPGPEVTPLNLMVDGTPARLPDPSLARHRPVVVTSSARHKRVSPRPSHSERGPCGGSGHNPKGDPASQMIVSCWSASRPTSDACGRRARAPRASSAGDMNVGNLLERIAWMGWRRSSRWLIWLACRFAIARPGQPALWRRAGRPSQRLDSSLGRHDALRQARKTACGPGVKNEDLRQLCAQ